MAKISTRGRKTRRRVRPKPLAPEKIVAPDIAGEAALTQTQAPFLDNERRLSTLFANLPGMAYSCQNDPNWTMTIVSEGCKALTGYAQSELQKNSTVAYGDLVHPEDRDNLWDKCQASLDAHKTCSNEYRINTKSGEVRWVWERAEGVYAADGTLLGIEGFVQDITERKRSEAAISKMAQRLEIALEGSQISVWEADLRTNEIWLDAGWATYLGKPAAETRTTSRELLALVHPEDREHVAAAAVQTMKGETASYAIDHRVLSANGEWKWLLSRGRVIERDATGRPLRMSGTNADITERKKNEEQINELAFFDQLTGLPNRTLLLDRLKQAVVASSRSRSHGALLFIDLDNFKTLNDTLGHDIGDVLLRQVAQRLSLCVRAGDTVARFGGDEFVVILAGLSRDETEAATGTEIVVQKVIASLNNAYSLGGHTHHTTASIGVTLFGENAVTADDLMKQADLAMYKSKEVGRNAWRFYDPRMESAVKERASLNADLRLALMEKQFALHYQAQVLGDHHVTGAEVLIRWQHPRRGMVSPAEFIPLAEESGMILPVGHWVLETACIQLARWADRAEMAHLTVAVNVSARQFRQADFVDHVLTVLRNTGANPQRLKLELTESLLVDNVQDVIEKMIALRTEGVGFSLDDFGTGYSSLSYLRRLPLDNLKIDQSFVRDLLTDPNNAAIAKTIVALAQNLGLGVIAEGVETEAQRDFLASAGCLVYQGYFFSRPLPVDDFDVFAQKNRLVSA